LRLGAGLLLLRLVQLRTSISAMLDFLGIGAQKAATTWLCAKLSLHPELEFPGGKEVHFWDRREGRAAAEWLALFETTSAGALGGELTPAYAFLERESIREIHRCRPELRLFYSVRNPIERAWSAALMALERAELELGDASDQWFVDHFTSAGSLARGDYLDCLERWWSFFPTDQLRVIFYDDILSDPRTVLVGLADHLGVDGSFYLAPSDADLQIPVRRGPNAEIRSTLVPVLRRLYDEKIAAFADRMGRNLDHWLAC